jgi:hypothetical protein
MKKQLLIYAAAALFAAPLISSCDDDEYTHPREVIIMNENGDVITGDTIEVKLGSTNRTVFNVWYEHWYVDTVYFQDTLYFWRQYDDNEPEDLSTKPDPDNEKFVIRHEDLLPVEGWGGGTANNVSREKYEMRTAFSKKFVHTGSMVKIWACVGDYAKGEVYYKVVE